MSVTISSAKPAGNTDFVADNSIVREIWGKSDTILLIFAGAAAEFALSKAVDWLYFTGRLPQDPLGRLFSTVIYARKIVFSSQEDALKAIHTIASIHQGVEMKRGRPIPDWAYRDVLFMLIDYSIRSYELLERPLKAAEKQEVFRVFLQVGQGMNITGLPSSFDNWLHMREDHLRQNLESSHYTKDLFKQYRKHLGPVRYFLLVQLQAMVVPERVRSLMEIGTPRLIQFLLRAYKLSKKVRLDSFFKNLVLPSQYKTQIEALDHRPGQATHKK